MSYIIYICLILFSAKKGCVFVSYVETTDKEREKNVHVIWSFSAIT